MRLGDILFLMRDEVEDIARRGIHCASVSTINVTGTSERSDPGDFVESIFGTLVAPGWVFEYSADAFNHVVPTLTSRFPNLRTLTVDCPADDGDWDRFDYHHTWVVHFTERHDPSDGIRGTIEVVRPISWSNDSPLLTSHTPPSSSYTLRSRIDVELDQAEGPAGSLAALVDPQRSDVLHHLACLGDVPVTLGDIISLIQRQVDAGYDDRLRCVEASAVAPYDIREFGSFASIASVSLDSLRLKGFERACEMAGSDWDQWLSADDLPSIIEIIGGNLPNLRILEIDIRGLERAEEVCGKAITAECFSTTGSITELTIDSGPGYDSRPLVNTIRLLYGVCAHQAHVRIARKYNAEVEDGRRVLHTVYCDRDRRHPDWAICDQTTLLAYFQKLSRRRKAEVAILDFRSLGAETYKEVMGLTFDANDRPMPVWDGRLVKWADQGRAVSAVIPSLGDRLDDLAEAAARFRDKSRAAESGEAEERWQDQRDAAGELTETLRQARAAVQKMSTLFDQMWDDCWALDHRIAVRQQGRGEI